MHFAALLSAASVASVALAAPAPLNTIAGGSFTVSRVVKTSSKVVTLSPKQAMAKAFNKHGLPYSGNTAKQGTVAARAVGKEDAGLGGLLGGLGGAAGGAGGAAGLLGGLGGAAGGAGGAAGLLGGLGGAGGADGAAGLLGGLGGAGAGTAATTAAAPVGSSATAAAAKKGKKGKKGGKAGAAGAAGAGAGTAAAGAGTAASRNNGTASAGRTSGNSTSAAGSRSSGNSTSTSATGQTGEAANQAEEMGSFYLTQVNVGGQMLNLNLDTGSADLWVAATKFDTTKSTSFKNMTGSKFKIMYGDGSSASGSVGTDVVSIGSASVAGQAVEIATTVSPSFQQEPNTDGLLGLSFSNINSVTPTKQKTFFDSIKSQLAAPVFTVQLNSAGAGEYEFGKVDTAKYTGNITYTPINSTQGFWGFESTTYKVAGKVFTNSAPTGAIADTGTTLCLVDPNVATQYYSQVTGATLNAQAGGYTYPCNAELPEFAVALGTTGEYVNIPSSAITFSPLAQGSATCFGAIQSNEGQPVQIYGDALLKEHFVIFDGDGPKLGFATSASNTTAAAAARK